MIRDLFKLVEMGQSIGEAISAGYAFPERGTIVDVAGGNGSLLATILKTRPGLRGVVMDLAFTKAEAERNLAARGVADRCSFVAGDFFTEVPAGGDLYTMKWILHDWSDEKAAAILRTVHRAMPDHAKLLLAEAVVREVNVPETITVAELAHKMAVKASEVIKHLMKLGQMVTINQPLDQDTAMIVVEEMGHKAIVAALDDPEAFTEEESSAHQADSLSRPPVVTVMGHVDHGKTRLLDSIRSTEVIKSEAGGITQHIGAYTVEKDGHKITFIDTPGHVDFGYEVSRSLAACEGVVLVVDAAQGIEAQTLANCYLALENDLEIVAALNKIDLLPPETRQTLMTRASAGSERARHYPISAQTGEGVDQLLEAIGAFLTRNEIAREISVPLSDGATLAWLYRHGEVRSRHDEGEIARLVVALDATAAAQFDRRLVR